MKLRPLGDRVLVRPLGEDEKVGSIVIPDIAKEKPTQGAVEAVGDGAIDSKGNKKPMTVKVGDRVLFARYAGTEVRLGDREYRLLHETEILAVI